MNLDLVQLIVLHYLENYVVCLFVCVAALPLLSKQGASEVKDTCLHRVKEFRKGGATATAQMRSC